MIQGQIISWKGNWKGTFSRVETLLDGGLDGADFLTRGRDFAGWGIWWGMMFVRGIGRDAVVILAG